MISCIIHVEQRHSPLLLFSHVAHYAAPYSQVILVSMCLPIHKYCWYACGSLFISTIGMHVAPFFHVVSASHKFGAAKPCNHPISFCKQHMSACIVGILSRCHLALLRRCACRAASDHNRSLRIASDSPFKSYSRHSPFFQTRQTSGLYSCNITHVFLTQVVSDNRKKHGYSEMGYCMLADLVFRSSIV